MAFGDVNIQNTQTTTAAAQPTPVATPVVPEVTPVVIDTELQKMLQKLGLNIEQWNAMSPQEQAYTRTQYAQIQQQEASEQTGMGVTGLHVEHTGDTTQPEQAVVPQTTPASTEQPAPTETPSTVTGENTTSTDSSEKAKEKDPSWLEWKIKTNENKRKYLREKAIESGQFEGKTDEEIDQLLDGYFEFKTKERLTKKENNISDEEWQNLTAEEKMKMMDETWNSISSDKNRQKEIDKTISDYTLMVSSNLTLEEYNNLTKEEKRLLKLEQTEKQIKTLESMGADDPDSEYHYVLENATKQASISTTKQLKNNLEKTNIVSSSKYKNIINDALSAAGIEEAEKLSREEKIQLLSDYVKQELDSAQTDDEYNIMLVDIASALLEAESTEKLQNSLVFEVMSRSGKNSSDVIRLINDSDFCQKYGDYLAKQGANCSSEDVIAVTTTFETLEQQANNINLSDEALSTCTANMRLLGNTLTNAIVSQAIVDDPENLERSLNNHLILLNCNSKYLSEAAANETQKNGEVADIFYGNLSRTTNPNAQELVNKGLQGRDTETQLRREANLINSNPTSKNTYDLINGATRAGVINPDAQQSTTDMLLGHAKEHLSEEDAKQVHKDHHDAAAVGFTAENQAYAHKAIMDSGYTEVQEYAASNIYKLDESVRDWAEEYTKSLGIESVTNAIQTEPPANTDINATNNTSSFNNNIITTTEAQVANNVIQEIKSTLFNEETGDIKLDLNNQEDRAKLVEFFEKNPIEMAKIIDKAPLKNKEALLIALCQSSKSAAISFVKQNPAMGLLILSCSQIELAVQHDIAKTMLQKADKGSDIWKTASNFLGKYYKGENTPEQKLPSQRFEIKA